MWFYIDNEIFYTADMNKDKGTYFKITSDVDATFIKSALSYSKQVFEEVTNVIELNIAHIDFVIKTISDNKVESSQLKYSFTTLGDGQLTGEIKAKDEDVTTETVKIEYENFLPTYFEGISELSDGVTVRSSSYKAEWNVCEISKPDLSKFTLAD